MAPSAPAAHRPLPLADVRVLSLEQYGAGPWGTLHLADLGAEIVKIEDPSTGGDVGRSVPPYAEGGDSLFFESLNRNKRSVSLDLRSPDGRAAFEDLVRGSDAVFSNLRGDVPAKLRIRYADLQHLNPAIVCCSLSGFGMTGPRSDGPGYDYMLQGLAGWMDLTGEPGGVPTKTGLSLVDWTGGYVAALSLVIGLHAARRDGVGMDCDVSLFDTAVAMLNYPAAWHLNAGFTPTRTRHSSHPSLVPFGNFEAADGWLVVACPKDKFFRLLAGELGVPSLADDPRFADVAARLAHRGEVLAVLEPLFRAATVEHWIDRLTAAGVPVAPVQTVAVALADPHTVARGLVVETAHPRWGLLRTLASPVRVGSASALRYRRAPARGEDTEHVLAAVAGYDADRARALAHPSARPARPDRHDPDER